MSLIGELSDDAQRSGENSTVLADMTLRRAIDMRVVYEHFPYIHRKRINGNAGGSTIAHPRHPSHYFDIDNNQGGSKKLGTSFSVERK